jgi:hypothetical protein
MADRYGRFNVNDGLNLAQSFRRTRMVNDALGEKEANREIEKKVYEGLAWKEANPEGNLPPEQFPPEAQFKIGQKLFEQKFNDFKLKNQEQLLSNAGRDEKIKEYQVRNLELKRLGDAYYLARGTGNNDEARRIARQINNEHAGTTGIFTDIDPKRPNELLTRRQINGQEKYMPDLPITQYDELIAKITSMPEQDLMNMRLGFDSMRIKINEGIFSKAKPLINDKGDIIYEIPSGLIDKTTGNVLGKMYVRSSVFDATDPKSSLPIDEETVRSGGFYSMEEYGAKKLVKSDKLDLEAKRADIDKKRQVSPGDVVTTTEGQGTLTNKGGKLTLNKLSGGTIKKEVKPSDKSELYKQSLKKLETDLMPFVEKGSTAINFDTGELTSGGNNALLKAQELIRKQDSGQALTPSEETNIKFAYRAVARHRQMSENATAELQDSSDPLKIKGKIPNLAPRGQ